MRFKYDIFAKRRRKALFDFAFQDQFFADTLHSLSDYGIDISFSPVRGAGAYHPSALSTERLDTPEKQAAFAKGFWAMTESGNIKAHITIPFFASKGRRVHDFIHEIMHVYQDMCGLYFLPLQEQGAFPVALDAYSDIVVISFCEAWAQTETIRSCWAIKENGKGYGWRGALSHPDFGYMARAYDADLKNGMDEARAAAKTFARWYEGAHREFYERHALNIYELNFVRYMKDAPHTTKEEISQNMRHITWAALMAYLPQNSTTKYFDQLDHDIFGLKTPEVIARVQALEHDYGQCKNTAIADIKCGAPPYIWGRLRHQEISTSELPPPDMSAQ